MIKFAECKGFETRTRGYYHGCLCVLHRVLSDYDLFVTFFEVYLRRLAAPNRIDLKNIHRLVLAKIQKIQLDTFNNRCGGAVESYVDVPHAVYSLRINCWHFAPNPTTDNAIELKRLQFVLIIQLICETGKLIAPLVRMFHSLPRKLERRQGEQIMPVDVAVFGGHIDLPSSLSDSTVPAVRMMSRGAERAVSDSYISRAMTIFSFIMGEAPPSDVVKDSLRRLLSGSPTALQIASAPLPTSSNSSVSETQPGTALDSPFPEPSPHLAQPDFFAVSRYYCRSLRCEANAPQAAIDAPLGSATSSALKAALHSFRSSMKASSTSSGDSKQIGNSTTKMKTA